ncbi:aminotransferase class V-fold PLP-dependent enzyme [Succinimonas sp.]|uniref:aminotransferase class V-fold PLP-dependent enzyme n=1 Tax=Succinimonas sp. TaxID=1936151 RepID=UPI00386D7D5F
MKFPVYLDYAATSPADPRVAEKMMTCLTLDGVFGNAASKSHSYGWQAAEAVDIARNQVADFIGADSREIVFTSGATESDNLAVIGLAWKFQGGERNVIITSAIEHKAILDSCAFAEKLGFQVIRIKPDREGRVTPEMLREHLNERTLLVTLMHANNEIGTVQDIKALADTAHEYGALFHSDCAQSAGKIKIDVREQAADYLSFSGHKLYGPKGIGAFYIRNTAPRPEAVVHGGGHERGLRSGTLATHQIAGLGLAYEIAGQCFDEENARIRDLRERLRHGLCSLSGVLVNGSLRERLPGNLNLTFRGVNGEQFLLALTKIAVSTGSACTSASVNPSYVLKALGLSDEEAHASIRFSLGRFTTEEEIDFTVDYVKAEYLKLKAKGSFWK